MSRSRKRRRYHADTRKAAVQSSAQQQAITRTQAEGVLLAALDGYSNAAAFLGDDSTLLSAGTFVRLLRILRINMRCIRHFAWIPAVSWRSTCVAAVRYPQL